MTYDIISLLNHELFMSISWTYDLVPAWWRDIRTSSMLIDVLTLEISHVKNVPPCTQSRHATEYWLQALALIFLDWRFISMWPRTYPGSWATLIRRDVASNGWHTVLPKRKNFSWDSRSAGFDWLATFSHDIPVYNWWNLNMSRFDLCRVILAESTGSNVVHITAHHM